jgi:hypothetical protein
MTKEAVIERILIPWKSQLYNDNTIFEFPVFESPVFESPIPWKSQLYNDSAIFERTLIPWGSQLYNDNAISALERTLIPWESQLYNAISALERIVMSAPRYEYAEIDLAPLGRNRYDRYMHSVTLFLVSPAYEYFGIDFTDVDEWVTMKSKRQKNLRSSFGANTDIYDICTIVLPGCQSTSSITNLSTFTADNFYSKYGCECKVEISV